MKEPLRDASKLCDSYQEIGHEMQDCKYLKKEINDLLSMDYLGDLVGNNERRGIVPASIRGDEITCTTYQ